MLTLNSDTMMGAMANYVSDHRINKLVPMNANYGIFKTDINVDKKEKRKKYAEIALNNIKEYKEKIHE